MLEFLYLPVPVLLVICLLGITSFVLLGIATFLGIPEFRVGKGNVIRLTENLHLAACFVLTAYYYILFAQILEDGFSTSLEPSIGQTARWLLYSLVLSLSIMNLICTRKWTKLLPAIIFLPLIPAAEQLPGGYFPLLLVASLLLSIGYGASMIKIRKHELFYNLSNHSIKEGIDALHTGILFADPDGTILLINSGMENLLYRITGTIYYPGIPFKQEQMEKLMPEVKKRMLDDREVYLLPGGSVWLFGYSRVPVMGKEYTQLAATDVTEQWQLTQALEQEKASLEAQKAELGKMLSVLSETVQREEVLRARIRIHDLMNQRLTLLLRALQSEKEIRYSALEPLVSDLMEQIKAEDAPPLPLEEAMAWRRQLDALGVALTVTGDFPSTGPEAALAVDFIREGINNAVRHGLAKSIAISASHTEMGWKLAVENNGVQTATAPAEGSGLRALRRKALQLGGKIEIETSPQFCLILLLPPQKTSAT